MLRTTFILPIVALLASISPVEAALKTPKIVRDHTSSNDALLQSAFSIYGDRPDNCPPCFNCNLEASQCHQFANCTSATGRCSCPEGWGGEDCTEPLCGSLAGGKDRPIRKGDQCDCSEGWGGINCNVCQTDNACSALVPGGEGAVCYKDGLVVRQNFQNCDITNKQILKILGEKKPQVTFSCDKQNDECNFQCKSCLKL